MANIRNSNTFYIDGTAQTLDVKNIKVTHISLTATGANAVLVLKDVSTGNLKIDLRVATSGVTTVFPFETNPLVFPNGINPSTVTNAVATLMLQETRS